MPHNNSSKGTGPSMSFLQKHFGPTFMQSKRKEDIELPMPFGGGRDPRLPVNKKSKFSKIKEGYSMWNKTMNEINKDKKK